MKRFSMLITVGFLLLSVAIVAGEKPQRVAKLLAETKAKIQEINDAELLDLKTMHPNMIIVDVREQSEWDQGHLKEAQLINRAILEFRIEKIALESDTPIVLYCAGGNRSALAAERLEQMGYTAVFSLSGGFSSLVANGSFEIEKPQ